jgi:hypothetical protein
MTFWLGLALLAIPILIGAFFLFKDSMNLFQKVGRLYWITRNNMQREQPLVSRAFLAHDSRPYWQGKGLQFAYRRWSFQVGILVSQAKRFNPDLYFKDSRLRDWRRPKK